ncbi:MAG: hypothetical protein QW555_00190 [Nitrososphaerota archaeon]
MTEKSGAPIFLYSRPCSEALSPFSAHCSVVYSYAGQPIIVAAALLASHPDRKVVVIDEGRLVHERRVMGVISAPLIIGWLLEPHDVWRHFMKMRCSDAAQPVAICEPADTLSVILDRLSSEGSEVVLLDCKRDGQVRALDTTTLAMYMGLKQDFRSLLKSYTCADISPKTTPIYISLENTLRESIHYMVNKGVDRLIVKEARSVLSAESITHFLFGSTQNMELLRDEPDRLLELELGELEGFFLQPGLVSRNDNLETALDRVIGSKARCCLIDGEGMITPRDLTVGLYEKIRSEAWSA